MPWAVLGCTYGRKYLEFGKFCLAIAGIEVATLPVAKQLLPQKGRSEST